VEARLLGSGGFVPTRARGTACVYLRDGEDVLLLDAGTGLSRLIEDSELLDGVERLYVIVTHFHLDHIVGLPYLAALGHLEAREVWGAGPLVAGVATRELVHRLLDPPFQASRVEDIEEKYLTAIRDLAPPGADVGPFSVTVRVQTRHATPTLGVRVGDLAYCTDTAYDEATADFVRGARILLHDAFHASDSTDDESHTAAGEAARVAAAAGVERLVLVHVNPERPDEEGLLRFARPHFPASEVGRDGLVVAT
jgi:ribonuclease BN (tRNA processing enzyme)